MPKGVSIAVSNFEDSSKWTWKNPLVLSNTAKWTASFNNTITSSSVLALHTGLTMYGLRSVGSRHMRSLPFGFLTTTKELSHSGTLTFASSSLLRIHCETILSSSYLNWSFSANGTLRGGFCTGTALHAIFICTGSYLNLPIPWKRCLYFGLLTILRDVSICTWYGIKGRTKCVSGGISATSSSGVVNGAVFCKESQVARCI